MPLSNIETLEKARAWALWKIEESEPDLSFLSFESCPDDIVHPQKRLEWLAGRALIRALTEHIGLSYEGLTKDEFGKPFLKEHPHAISLSHSYPYVAAQIDKSQLVGIDVEQVKEKLHQVGPRILSPEEFADAQGDAVKLCIYWCAKESMYKIYGKRNLLFSDHLRIQPFVRTSAGTIVGEIDVPPTKMKVQLGYRVTSEYVLVFTESMSQVQ